VKGNKAFKFGSDQNFMNFTPGVTVVEGVASERISGNLEMAIPALCGAYIGSDREAVEMAYFLKEYEGLIVGSSAALNFVGAVKTA
jgi:cysteine synthase A